MNGHRPALAWFDETRAFSLDQLTSWAEVLPELHASIAERRARLIRHLHARYGVTVHPHPRLAHVVVVSRSDYATLEDLVTHDRLLDAVGRGYYGWLGGELSVIVAPDWSCNPTSVALARLYAVAVVPWARPVVRALTRLLGRTRG